MDIDDFIVGDIGFAFVVERRGVADSQIESIPSSS